MFYAELLHRQSQVNLGAAVTPQLWRQQALHEGRLATALRTNQCWHTLVAVLLVHLQELDIEHIVYLAVDLIFHSYVMK